MNLLKIEMTQSQKNIIVISAAALFVLLLLWVFLYLPGSKEITSLKNELSSTQQQIQGIEALLSGSQSRDEAIRILKQRQLYLSNKFPRQEEESLRLIPEVARKMNISVVSLQPGLRSEFLDEAGRQVVIDGKTASYLPITMEVVCFYKDMVSYLTELKNSLPAFISVVSLNVVKDNQLNGKVRSTIGFNLYLLI
jgi:Tfp pilus assembly protein PilO